MPILYVLSGPDIGKTHEVDEGAVLGRIEACDVVLRGGSVSRKHARLARDGDTWYLLDMGSRNGLRLDGVKVEEIKLADGLNFQVGDLELRFRHEVQGVREAPAAKPAPEPEPEPEVEFADDFEEERAAAPSDDGIEFEDEDLFDAPTPKPQAPASAPTAAPEPALRVPKTKSAATPSVPDRRAERMAAAGIRASKAESVPVSAGGRPILQYSQTADSSGFLTSDLGQYPLWVRLLAGVAALALFAGVFYFAMRGSSTLKERAVGAGGGAGEVEESVGD